MADISFNIVCKEVQIVQLNQLFELLHFSSYIVFIRLTALGAY